MSTPRTPLGSIDGNITRKKELTPFQRGQISRMFAGGAKKSAISKHYNLLYSTVADTINLEHLYEDGASQPKAPRKLSYTLMQERRVLRYTRTHLKDTYKEIIKACLLTCLKNIVKKILKKHKLKKWKCKRCPFLTTKNAKARLA
jgi:hypothetical protein